MKIRNIQFNKDNLFFTSDTHFFHRNIIKYCDRPFKTMEEMNETLVRNWNKVVPKDGVVFHAGDFSMGAKGRNLGILLGRLNGKIHLTIGNHENDITKGSKYISRFETIHDISDIYVKDEEISYGKQHLIICHYPMLAWDASHRGSWQLFGHVHGGLSNKGHMITKPTQLDIGVDCHDFSPISYQTVKELITKQCLK